MENLLRNESPSSLLTGLFNEMDAKTGMIKRNFFKESKALLLSVTPYSSSLDRALMMSELPNKNPNKNYKVFQLMKIIKEYGRSILSAMKEQIRNLGNNSVYTYSTDSAPYTGGNIIGGKKDSIHNFEPTHPESPQIQNPKPNIANYKYKYDPISEYLAKKDQINKLIRSAEQQVYNQELKDQPLDQQKFDESKPNSMVSRQNRSEIKLQSSIDSLYQKKDLIETRKSEKFDEKHIYQDQELKEMPQKRMRFEQASENHFDSFVETESSMVSQTQGQKQRVKSQRNGKKTQKSQAALSESAQKGSQTASERKINLLKQKKASPNVKFDPEEVIQQFNEAQMQNDNLAEKQENVNEMILQQEYLISRDNLLVKGGGEIEKDNNHFEPIKDQDTGEDSDKDSGFGGGQIFQKIKGRISTPKKTETLKENSDSAIKLKNTQIFLSEKIDDSSEQTSGLQSLFNNNNPSTADTAEPKQLSFLSTIANECQNLLQNDSPSVNQETQTQKFSLFGNNTFNNDKSQISLFPSENKNSESNESSLKLIVPSLLSNNENDKKNIGIDKKEQKKEIQKEDVPKEDFNSFLQTSPFISNIQNLEFNPFMNTSNQAGGGESVSIFSSAPNMVWDQNPNSNATSFSNPFNNIVGSSGANDKKILIGEKPNIFNLFENNKKNPAITNSMLPNMFVKDQNNQKSIVSNNQVLGYPTSITTTTNTINGSNNYNNFNISASNNMPFQNPLSYNTVQTINPLNNFYQAPQSMNGDNFSYGFQQSSNNYNNQGNNNLFSQNTNIMNNMGNNNFNSFNNINYSGNTMIGINENLPEVPSFLKQDSKLNPFLSKTSSESSSPLMFSNSASPLYSGNSLLMDNNNRGGSNSKHDKPKKQGKKQERVS